MITYERHTLANGLTVLAHREKFSRMAAVNMLYRVGARDEDPHRTGFAHLFEHLMFRGTRQVPDFDVPVQMASGENNAFTNNDYTDYYITLPVDNTETALWLESDRMTGLAIDRKNLEAEKKVVIEEYKQRYLNQPYGDLWLLLRALAFKEHPYRWATIGLTPEHIAGATLREVREFYRRFYNPSNAILSVAADLDPERVFALAEKWFGPLPDVSYPKPEIPQEPLQTVPRRLEVVRDVPATVVTVAFRMCGRTGKDFYPLDMISDLLAGGTSSRLYRRLVQEGRLFASANAYVTGDVDPGLFVVTGNLLPGVEPEAAEAALWEQLESLKREPVGAAEAEKVKNKFEANTTFGEINVMNKAMNLGFYEMLGDLPLINREVEIYRSLTPERLMECAAEVFVPECSSTLVYRASGDGVPADAKTETE